jgi:hypothetical protein
MRALLCLLIMSTALMAQVRTTPFRDPVALSRLQPAGDLFALSNDPGRVYKLHDDGQQLSLLGSFALPGYRSAGDFVAAVVNGEQDIIITGVSLRSGFVDLYGSDGTPKRSWTSSHVLGGPAYDPNGRTIYTASEDSNEIYRAGIADTDKSMKFVAEVVGAKSLGPVVLDTVRGRLLIGDVDGGYLYSLGLTDHKSHLLAQGLGTPRALMLSTDGRELFIADSASRRIYRLDLTHAGSLPVLFCSLPQSREPDGLALLSAGRVAVTDKQRDAIFVITPACIMQSRFPPN